MRFAVRTHMEIRPARSAFSACTIALTMLGVSVNAHAACPTGLIERGAGSEDRVCVSPAKRRMAMAENARAPMLWGAGSYGPRTCALGNVWREAFAGDLVCVSAERREQVRQENLAPQGVP